MYGVVRFIGGDNTQTAEINQVVKLEGLFSDHHLRLLSFY
jgi:hypothetical protein